jgi:hypothetical protein
MPTGATGSAATDQLRVQVSPGVVMAVDSGGSIILEVGDPLAAVKRVDMPCMTEYEAAANRCLTEPGPLGIKVAPLLVVAGDGAGHLTLEAGHPQIGTVRAAMSPMPAFTGAVKQCRQYVAGADDASCAQRAAELTAVLAERSRKDA